MKNKNKNIENKNEISVFFESELRTASEAGAILVKIIIEEELIHNKVIPQNSNCYEWVSKYLGRSKSTIRKWTYDWNTKNGSPIPFIDLLKLASLSNSRSLLRFVETVVEGSSKDIAKEHSIMINKIGSELVEVGKKFIIMSRQVKK